LLEYVVELLTFGGLMLPCFSIFPVFLDQDLYV
jgi:hypothetical protein